MIIIIIATISFNSFNHLRNRIDQLEQKYSLLESRIISNHQWQPQSIDDDDDDDNSIVAQESFDQLISDIIDEWQLRQHKNEIDFIIEDDNDIDAAAADDDTKQKLKKFHNRFEQLVQMVSTDCFSFFV
mgnify:CR=1 FL=1